MAPPAAPVGHSGDQVSLAELVATALAAAGVSIRETAARTGGAVSYSQIARIARGQTARIRPQTMTALSSALGIPIAKLRAANGWDPSSRLTPFVLPERANELSTAERRLVVNVIGALLAAHDDAATR